MDSETKIGHGSQRGSSRQGRGRQKDRTAATLHSLIGLSDRPNRAWPYIISQDSHVDVHPDLWHFSQAERSILSSLSPFFYCGCTFTNFARWVVIPRPYHVPSNTLNVSRRQPRPMPVQAVVGSPANFWIWSRDSGWDLTHPSSTVAPHTQSRLPLNCEISNVTIDPEKTALLIIDMQNFSMSSALGANNIPAVFQAQEMLLRYGIPAAHRAGILIIWLNWGLTEQDLESITPGAMRVFGWRANCEAADYGIFNRSLAVDGTENMVQCGERPLGNCPGDDLGDVVLTGETRLDAGRVLMRDTWNAELHGPLLSAFQEGQEANRPDVLIHKDRNSGMYDASCDCTQYLERSGIRTLLFAGMNTDQCIMATLLDAQSRGFDTILLKDACATDSPNYAQQSADSIVV